MCYFYFKVYGDYSKTISNYFEEAIKNKPGRMSRYIAAIERTDG